MDINWVSPRNTARETVRESPRDAERIASRDVVPTGNRSTVRANARSSRAESRADTRMDDDDRPPTPGRDHSVSKAEFAALLALLSGAGTSVREELVQRLPEDAASLVDRLLDGQAEAVDPEGENNAASESTAVIDLTAYARSRQSDMTTSAASGVAREAREAVRPMPEPSTPRTRETTGADHRPHDAAQGIAQEIATSDVVTSPGSDSDAQRTRLRDALSRVSSRRGASMEQLLALGDANAVDARVALDSLLAQAGTPAGARLAARSIMSGANASLLGENSPALAFGGSAFRSPAASVGAAKSVDATTPVKALDGLDPELRTRVNRVIERMKNEYGHDVSIVETTRSQERQDWLYEQGRTREGSVVTWTRDSAHTRGEAVDVIIDGRYENAAGFGRLQRIAREEGLRTLGMKDPGHLELAHQGARVGAGDANRAPMTSRNDPASSAGVARVAGVAGVATVARVADASATARPMAGMAGDHSLSVASQGVGRGSHNSSTNQEGASSESERGSSRGEHRRSDRIGGAIGALSEPHGAIGSTFGQGATISVTSGTERASGSAGASGSDQVQRVADIQQMRADAPATPLARMTLNVDNANGTQERITVDLRGNTVSTHISTDASTADSLRLRTAELQDALGRHGLDGDTVRVSGTRQDPTDAARVAGLERDALKLQSTAMNSQDGAAGNGQRERAPWERQARDGQQESSRREQAAQTRDDRQEQQGRQRRPNFFLGNE